MASVSDFALSETCMLGELQLMSHKDEISLPSAKLNVDWFVDDHFKASLNQRCYFCPVFFQRT